MTAKKQMTKRENKGLKRLENILDTYGAMRSRWPESERESLEGLIERDVAAQRMLDEAAALDRVIDMAPGMTASQDLKDRIMAAAMNDSEKEARVVPIGSRKRGTSDAGAGHVGTYWPAAALAASFAFGLYLGVAGLGDRAYDGAVEVSGLSSEVSEWGGVSYWLDYGSVTGTEGIL